MPRYRVHFSLLDEFDKFIWILLSIAVLSIWFYIYFKSKLSINYKQVLNQWIIITILFQQSFHGKIFIKDIMLRLLFILWTLSCLVLTTCYAGCIYSIITLPRESKIETINDLVTAAKNGYLNIIIHKTTNYYLFKVIKYN